MRFREGSPAGKRYNRLTFELIRRWLDEKSSQKHQVMDEVQAYCNGTLKTYFGQVGNIRRDLLSNISV